MTIAWEQFQPWQALLGGALIGLSATWMMLFHGRISGIAGIGAGAVDHTVPPHERGWRLSFVAGLVLGGLALLFWMPGQFESLIERSPWVLAAAGVLVGVGTRLGSGCTSGHGVCGISRGSVRSIVATLTFTASGAATVAAYRAIFGGL